jgi:hypothetical protein
MSDEIEEIGGTGLDRRSFLKRSAIVGGMVWAAPLIQSAPAFAQTSGTGITEIPEGCQAISYLAFVLHNDGSTKYKYEDATGGCTIEGGGNLDAVCSTAALEASWSSAVAGGHNDGKVTVDCSDDKVWSIDPAPGYGVQWALVKSGAAGQCTVFGSPTTAYGAKDETVYVYQIQTDPTVSCDA